MQVSGHSSKRELYPRDKSMRKARYYKRGKTVVLRLELLEDRTTPASFHGIGIPNGEVSSSIRDISADGSVAVGLTSNGTFSKAVRWTETDGFLTLGGFEYIYPDSIATAVSPDGKSIVGNLYNNYNGRPWDPQRAFSWTSESGIVAHGFIEPFRNSGNYSFANAVTNNRSVIVGTSNIRPFYLSNNVMLAIGTKSGNAIGVSNDGSLVIINEYESQLISYVWNAVTHSKVQIGPAGTTSNGASDSLAFVVGTSNNNGFVWSSISGFSYLEGLNGGIVTFATAISEDGTVIGGHTTVLDPQTDTTTDIATYWDENHVPHSVKDFLSNQYGLSAQLEGWTLTEVTGISNNGFIFAGNGIDPLGRKQAWIAEISPQDISINSLSWNDTNGSVDYSYKLSGNKLDQATTVSAYWATGTRFEDRLPNVPPITTITTGTAVGDSGLLNIPRSTLGTPPLGATHIIVVADPPIDDLPKGLVDPEDEGNNVKFLKLPDLKATYFAWNRNADIRSDPVKWGINYAYSIYDAQLPLQTTYAYYWSKSTKYDEADVVGGPYKENPLISQEIGDYGTPGAPFNEPARFGKAPAEAKYLLFVVDPEDKIIEREEDDNVEALKIHSESDLLYRSVSVEKNGFQIKAKFVPGSGKGLMDEKTGDPLSIAEAEIVLGIDHFNWQQQITDKPSNWSIVTLPNLDYSKLNAVGIRIDDDNIIRYNNSDSTIYSNYADLESKHTPFYDPLVTLSYADDPLTSYTRGFVIQLPNKKSIIYWTNGGADGPLPDSYRYYWNEHSASTPVSWRNIENNTQATQLDIYDTPSQPISTDPFTNEGSPQYIAFETRLVGVEYDREQYRLWGGEGYRSNYTWKSNTVHEKVNNPSGGGVFITGGWGISQSSSERPKIIGGGIFDVRFDDNTIVAAFPITAPPLTTQPAVDHVLYANNQTQRSKFVTAQVYFDSLVTIQKNAFQLYLNNKPFTVSSFFTTVVDGKTVATLQFPFKLLPHASLPEGSYRLVTRAAAVKNLQNQKMTGDFTDSFFRLYGDVNGDGKVDGTDQSVFNTAYGKKANQAGYLWYLDYDGNGKIDAKDKAAFKARMGRHV